VRTFVVPEPAIARGELLALADGPITLARGGAVELWQGEPRVLATIGEAGVVAVDERLAALADDHELRVVELAGGAERRVPLGAAEGRRRLELSADGRRIVVTDAKRLAVLDVATLREAWRTDMGGVAAIAGEWLCHAAKYREVVRCVALADGTGAREHEMSAAVVALAGSRDGHSLAAALDDGAVVAIEMRTGSQRSRDLPRAPWRSLAFSPDAKVLALAGLDGALALWNLADDVVADGLLPMPSGEQVVGLATRRPALQRLAFTDDRSLLAIDAWGSARAIAIPPAGDAAALRAWILDATHARP
jgi:hypothetical protein